MAFFTKSLPFSAILLLLLLSNSLARTGSLVLPLIKQGETHQYLTQIHHGSHLSHAPIDLVVDLGGQSIWVAENFVLPSDSARLIPCKSVQCSTAMTTDHGCPSFFTKSICRTTPRNSISGISTKGELMEDDAIAVKSMFGLASTMPNLLISRAPNSLLQGLASGAGGMAGLGRSRTGLPAQLAGEHNVHRKFSICVPSSKISGGFVYFGDGLSNNRVAKSLLYTPLMTSPLEPDEYFIGVKSVKINGRPIDIDGSLLSFDENGFGGTKLSSVVAHTTMENSIYRAFTEAFVEEATGSAFNMSRVASVAPFEFCFLGSKSSNSKAVPVIDLVLQSEMVKWRIHGWNSMVQVSDDVTCLGFLDGGVNQTSAAIVIGGDQLENNLVEFDLGGSRLGFSSLLAKQRRCSDFISLGVESESWSS